MQINLFVNHYQCGDSERQKELDFCFEANKQNEYIDKIINVQDRLTYNRFFELTASYPNDINILANSDIYFDYTIKEVLDIKPRDCYAITRSELKGNTVVSFTEMNQYNKAAQARHSQDVWVFKGVVKNVFGNFPLGVPGCDNRIAWEIRKAGYNLVNPCHRIKCIHKHRSTERNYNIPAGLGERIPMPYLWVDPEGETNVKYFRTNI